MTATRIQAQPASNLVRTIPEGERVLPPTTTMHGGWGGSLALDPCKEAFRLRGSWACH